MVFSWTFILWLMFLLYVFIAFCFLLIEWFLFVKHFVNFISAKGAIPNKCIIIMYNPTFNINTGSPQNVHRLPRFVALLFMSRQYWCSSRKWLVEVLQLLRHSLQRVPHFSGVPAFYFCYRGPAGCCELLMEKGRSFFEHIQATGPWHSGWS